MHKFLSQQMGHRRANTHNCGNLGVATAPLRIVALLFASIAVFPGTARHAVCAPPEGKGDSQRPMPDARTITMTEEEFDEFMRERRPYQEAMPLLKEETFIPALTEDRRKRAMPFLYVQLPERRVAFNPRSVSIRLCRHDVRALIDALPHFPETRYVDVWIQFERPFGQTPHHSQYAATPVPLWVLEGLRHLPYMAQLAFQGGTFDDEAMAVIASYPNLRVLNLGHCRVTTESFAELSNAKSLESLSVQSGLGPDSFITLAKLPRLKEFTLLSSTSDFNVPIDDETRRAIESLDGFEVFYAREIGTVVHMSFVRALLQVKTLRVIDIDSVQPRATPADIEQLKRLPALKYANIGW